MNKNNLMESIEPCSGQYSLRADFRLNGWLLVAAIVYVAGHYAGGKLPTDDTLMRATLALTPLVPGLLYVRSWVRFIRGLDELQRRMQLETFLFAALGTVIVGAVVSTLNEQAVAIAWLEHGMGLGTSFMLMLLLWSVGWVVAKRRYK